MNRKMAFIFLVSVVFVLGVAAFFALKISQTTPQPTPITQLPPGGGAREPGAVAPDGVATQGGQILVSQPQKEEKSPISLTFFGTSVTIPVAVFEALKPLFPAATTQSAVGSRESTPLVSASVPAVQPLTEKEIFERIWPQSYREYLGQMHDFMVQDSFIDASRPITFASDQNIYDFLLLMFSYARSKGWITDEEFSKFSADTKGDFQRLIKDEEDALRKGGTTGLLLPGSQRFSRYTAKELFRDMRDGIGYILLQAKPAYAGWNTGQECYKDDNPNNVPKGSNSKTFCCNCGYLCVKTCVFKPDCGTNGSGCNVQLGCLNRVCASKPNAIWDKQTGTCGCG